MIDDLGAEIQGHNNIRDDTGSVAMNADQNLKNSRMLQDLPDAILSRILSMLPTKDAVAMQLVSKRMQQAFTGVTSLDFHDSPVSECPDYPHHAKHSPLFESFVNTTLKKFSDFGQPLTRFRLRLGGDKYPRHYHLLEKRGDCEEETCYSHLKPLRLNVWITYPLAHSGLRELALSFHVSKPYYFELPAGIFTCPSLELLNLDCNLELDDSEFPLICLPSLKRLYLSSFVFTKDDFLARLVPSCPVLEDLGISHCSLRDSDRVTISSRSLRELVLHVLPYDSDDDRNVVLIDTPNLQYLKYKDCLASSYSIVHMNALAEASITIFTVLDRGDEDTRFQSQLSLISAFSHIQHLSLLGLCVENVYFSGKLKYQLPVFHALKTLEFASFFEARWDIVLSLFLWRSPLLETLIFPKGLYVHCDGKFVGSFLGLNCRKIFREEAKAWGIDNTIPSAYMSCLQRIQLRDCYEKYRELNMINFFLRRAPVLKELDIWVHEGCNPIALQRQLEEVPRVSKPCSITVQEMP
ncbi:hypothetical protein vseg_005877 [Gypsophila vaccaria]